MLLLFDNFRLLDGGISLNMVIANLRPEFRHLETIIFTQNIFKLLDNLLCTVFALEAYYIAALVKLQPGNILDDLIDKLHLVVPF